MNYICDMIKPIEDHIVISSDKQFNDTIGDGLSLDPMYNPNDHVRTYAYVQELPMRVTEEYRNDAEKISVGDKVYFSYKMFDNSGSPTMHGNNLYVLPFRWIYAVEKPDGDLLMLDNWCLGEYIYPNDVYDDTDEYGRTIKCRKSPAGIIMLDIAPERNQAVILNDPLGELTGKTVHHEEAADWVYEIQGEDKLIIGRNLIFGTYE